MDPAVSEIRSFFTTLQPLSPALSEHIRLVNNQHIPVLVYCLMAHPLSTGQHQKLHKKIGDTSGAQGMPPASPPKPSPKDKYTPRRKGGLGGRHFVPASTILSIQLFDTLTVTAPLMYAAPCALPS